MNGVYVEALPVEVSNLDPTSLSVSLTYADLPTQVLLVDQGPPIASTVTTDFETWGLSDDHDLVVAECTDAEGLVCGSTATIGTTVANPSPTHDLSPSGTEFSEPFDLTIHLAHTTGAPRIKLTTDNGTPEYVDPEDVHPVDTVSLLEGPHQIDIAVCSEDELRCTPGETVDFEVVRSVLGAFSVSPLSFSPTATACPTRLTSTTPGWARGPRPRWRCATPPTHSSSSARCRCRRPWRPRTASRTTARTDSAPTSRTAPTPQPCECPGPWTVSPSSQRTTRCSRWTGRPWRRPS